MQHCSWTKDFKYAYKECVDVHVQYIKYINRKERERMCVYLYNINKIKWADVHVDILHYITYITYNYYMYMYMHMYYLYMFANVL